MSEQPAPLSRQAEDRRRGVSRRRAAFVLIVGAAIFGVTIFVLRATGRRALSTGIWVVVGTLLLADGLQLIVEWWRPQWFRPRG